MKNWVRVGLAVVVTASMTNLDASDADAGLLAKLFGKKDECCCCEPEPVCCEPEPVCCEPEPEPVCCEPEPVCCEPEPEPVCCEPEPEPCCEPEPEPCCEPEPEPEPCCEPEPEPCCASYPLPELAEGEVLVSITPLSLSAGERIVFTAAPTPAIVAVPKVATTLISIAR